jgi:hypothetical protein
MSDEFIIHDIKYDIHQTEPMGSKEKFWYRDKNNQRFLFKVGREGTGENWVEIAASGLADLIGIPHVFYEPAKYESKLGTICKTFVDKGSLIHGNEILHALNPGRYPPLDEPAKFKRIPEYTLCDTLLVNNQSKLDVPSNYCVEDNRVVKAIDVFIGYSLFDAWIGNTDRHHQNWGWILHEEGNRVSLAPTFDHASSLGREIRDEERRERLKISDQHDSKQDKQIETKGSIRSVESYAEKSFTPFYGDPSQSKVLTTFEVASILIEQMHLAAKYWIEKILAVQEEQIEGVLDKIPEEFISSPSRDFAVRILSINKERLNELYWKNP